MFIFHEGVHKHEITSETSCISILGGIIYGERYAGGYGAIHKEINVRNYLYGFQLTTNNPMIFFCWKV